MSYRVPAVALLGCLLASGVAAARETMLENIPLKWSPTSTLAEMGPVDLTEHRTTEETVQFALPRQVR